MFCNKKLLDYY